MPDSLPSGTRVEAASITAGWTPIAIATGRASPSASAWRWRLYVCRPSTSRATSRSVPLTSIRWTEAFWTPPYREKTIPAVIYGPASLG